MMYLQLCVPSFIVTLLLYKLELEILTFLSFGVTKPFCHLFGVSLSLIISALIFYGRPVSLIINIIV
jgi:hypothetical protein